MADFDDTQPLPQGNVKLSEIGVDRPQALIASSVNQSALKVVEQHMKISADLARKQNYIFRSEGVITWDGSKIDFAANAMANNILLEVLQTDSPTIHKYEFRLAGTTGANGPQAFKDITLAEGEMLYLEIDPAQLTLGNLTGGSYYLIENAVSGGSLVSGRTLRKQLISDSTGMPQAISPVDGSTSTTYYIALAMRRGQNIYWIPHGINWPVNTTSTLGNIIVEGLQVLPERFVGSETQLNAALSDLAADDGGIILITQPFTITTSKTLPPNTTLLGRGAKSLITMAAGTQFIMSENCELKDFKINAVSGYNTTMVVIDTTAKRCKLRNMIIDMTNATNNATTKGVYINTSNNRILDCWFIASLTSRIAIDYSTSISVLDNADVDCLFE